jgi:hypothetical protein
MNDRGESASQEITHKVRHPGGVYVVWMLAGEVMT